MLAKNRTYYHTELERNVFLHDYTYYGGTNEHSFQFDYGKEIIKSNNLEMFLLKIQEIKPKSMITTEIKKEVNVQATNTNYLDMQKILLETMRGLKDGTIKPEQAKAMAMVAQTLVNSVKVENQLGTNIIK